MGYRIVPGAAFLSPTSHAVRGDVAKKQRQFGRSGTERCLLPTELQRTRRRTERFQNATRRADEFGRMLFNRSCSASSKVKVRMPLALPVLPRCQHHLHLLWQSQWHTTRSVSFDNALHPETNFLTLCSNLIDRVADGILPGSSVLCSP